MFPSISKCSQNLAFARGTVGDGGFLFEMLEITADMKPLTFSASVTWLISRVFPLLVPRRLDAWYRRVEAVLISCFVPRWEEKFKYRSKWVGFGYTSVTETRVSRRAICPLFSISLVK